MSLKKSLTVCLMISLSALACGESKPQPDCCLCSCSTRCPTGCPARYEGRKRGRRDLSTRLVETSEVCYGQPKTLMAIEHYHLSEDGTGTIRTQSLTSGFTTSFRCFLFPTPKLLLSSYRERFLAIFPIPLSPWRLWVGRRRLGTLIINSKGVSHPESK